MYDCDNKDIDTEKLRNSQPVRRAELDRRLLERAEQLTEGRKTICTENGSVMAAFAAKGSKEADTMDKNTHINEVRSRRPAAFIAAAAVLALVIGGGAYIMKNGRGTIETDPTAASAPETADSVDEDIDDPTRPDENLAAGEERPKEWAAGYIAENSDTFGYISIPGLEYYSGWSGVESPVVIGRDNDFYLTHGFDKSEKAGGCIFADAGTDIDTDGGQPQIIQLYGSSFTVNGSETNADSSLMSSFDYLVSLQDINILSRSPIIDFRTIWQDNGKYAIIGMTDVQGDALGIGEVEDIDGWIRNIRDLSYFDCDIDCGADDKYLVLNVHDGERTDFRVFAKKLDESDDTEKIKNSYKEKEEQDTDQSSVTINIPLPKNVKGLYFLEVLMDGNKVLDCSISSEEVPDTMNFQIFGEGTKQAVVYIGDPLSSNMNSRIEYAAYSVDFSAGTYICEGNINYKGAYDLLDKYVRKIWVEYPMPEGIDTQKFDIYVDGVKTEEHEYTADGAPVSASDPSDTKGSFLATEAGTRTRRVELFAKDGDRRLLYAAYNVDFLTMTYKYAEGFVPNPKALTAFRKGSGGSVFVEIPVDDSLKNKGKLKFEAYYEDILMGSVSYSDDDSKPFGIWLTEDGVDNIRIQLENEGLFIKDYAIINVDFDEGKYVFVKDAPKTDELAKMMMTGS